MKLAICLASPTSCVDSQDMVPQRQGITHGNSGNAMQIFETSELKKQILERLHQIKQRDAGTTKRHWKDTIQFSENYKS